MYCHNCGRELSNNSKFCQNCGTMPKEQNDCKKDVETEKVSVEVAENGFKRMRILLVVIMVIVIFGVIYISGSRDAEGTIKGNVADKAVETVNDKTVENTKENRKETVETNRDEAIPTYRVDIKTAEADIAEFIKSENVIQPAFEDSLNDVVYTDIAYEYVDELRDDYCQAITYEYALFSRYLVIAAAYMWEDGEWVKDIVIIEDSYKVNDNIAGQWVYELKASHPMHKDSVILVDIAKLDSVNCNYSFSWTSRIEGGHDDSFSGSQRIEPKYDDDGKLSGIVIGYSSADGYIVIRPKGLMFESSMSAGSKYVLTKEY